MIFKRLGDICKLRNGRAFKPEEWSDRGLPIIRIQNLNDLTKPFNYCNLDIDDKFVVNTDDLLFSWSGTPGTSFGAFIWNRGKGYLNQHIFRVDVDNGRVDRKYLKYALNSQLSNIISQAHGGVGLQHITKAKLDEIPILLPPLEEQRRIASILDKADEIRQKRQQAIVKLDELLQAEFLNKFSSKNFKPVMVQDLLETEKSMRTGPFGSQLLHSEFVDEGIAVLGIDNAVKNQFQWGKPRFITEQKYKMLSRYTVKPNDVLITIMGTCGRCAVVPEDIPLAINTKHLCCITLDKTKCEPEFLHSYFLMHPTARNYLESRAKGAIMDGLNMGIIKELPVELPPLEDQKAFVKFKKAILSQKQLMDLDAEKIDQMFGSLQQKAFSRTL